MPPHERFTAHLLETLSSSRVEITKYIDRKKSEVDKEVEEYYKVLSEEEERIRTQKESLLAIQSERGLSSDEGIAQRREKLRENMKVLENRFHVLQEETRRQELVVVGECPMCKTGDVLL